MNKLVTTTPIEKDLIKQIAKDVGKDLEAYFEAVWPKVFETYPQKTFRISIRNHTYNCIMNAVKLADEGKTESWLAFNEKHRKVMRKLRRAKSIEEIKDAYK